MKLRHLLFGLLAGVAFVACTNDNEPAGVTPVDGDKFAAADRYMSVNFAMPGASTRADDDAEGTEEESKITSAAFLFFKGDAQVAEPFVIAPEGKDKADLTWDPTADAPDNVVIVMKNPTDIPTSLVVLINSGKTYEQLKAETVATLQNAAAFTAPTAAGPFVMSNAVYNDEGGQNVIGAPVALANVCESVEAAKANPVKVYVEREAAKVAVKNSATTNTIQPGENYSDVTITLTGWALVFENTKSSLIKNLDASYTTLPSTFEWNKPGEHRSYWATTKAYTAKAAPKYSEIKKDNFSTDENVNAVYTSENTWKADYVPATATERPTENPTAVIVAATLTKNGAAANSDLYKFRNGLYLKEGIMTLLANEAPYFKYDATNKKYVSLEASDYGFGTDPEEGRKYEVKAYLTLTETEGAEVFTITNGTATKVTDFDEANNKLEDAGQLVEKYAGGASYYYVPIEHFKAGNDAVLGVVRNHFYQLNITKVQGLGTAVPDPTQEIIPEVPDKKDYYIGAEINVHQWKLVSQEVHLGE